MRSSGIHWSQTLITEYFILDHTAQYFFVLCGLIAQRICHCNMLSQNRTQYSGDRPILTRCNTIHRPWTRVLDKKAGPFS